MERAEETDNTGDPGSGPAPGRPPDISPYELTNVILL